MKLIQLFAATAALGALAACGGGGSDSSPASPPPPPPPSAPVTLTLTGVVARGLALDSASVSATCATGSGTATTNAAGEYTLTINAASLPCVLAAESSDHNLKLHSVVPGSAATTSATANITSLTELLVAQLTRQVPSDFAATLSPTNLSTVVTSAAVTQAQLAVVSMLNSAGVDTSAITDLVSGALVATHGGSSGNGYDQVLDALAAQLTQANSTLKKLTETVADTASGTQGTVSVETNSLPADLLLRPHATNCEALRSTTYNLLKFAATGGAGNAITTARETFTMDAQTLTATFSPTDSTTFTANGNCRYTLPNGDAVVSPAGVMVIRAFVGSDDDTVAEADRGNYRMMVAVPAQNLAVADLAGDWRFLTFKRFVSTVGYYEAGYVTIGQNGALSNHRCWDNALTVAEANCSPISEVEQLDALPSSTGVFALHPPASAADQWVDAVLAYRAGNGHVMLVTLTSDGEPAFGVKRQAVASVPVGTVSNSIDVFGSSVNFIASSVGYSSNTILSIDASTGTATRTSSSNGGTPVTQTIEYSSVREGYNHRIATSGAREFFGLPMTAFGLAAVFMPNSAGSGDNSQFFLSVRYTP